MNQNERNIEQDRKYWYAKGKWDGAWFTFWGIFILHILTNIITYGGGNK
jgi:hypothetical protein